MFQGLAIDTCNVDVVSSILTGSTKFFIDIASTLWYSVNELAIYWSIYMTIKLDENSLREIAESAIEKFKEYPFTVVSECPENVGLYTAASDRIEFKFKIDISSINNYDEYCETLIEEIRTRLSLALEYGDSVRMEIIPTERFEDIMDDNPLEQVKEHLENNTGINVSEINIKVYSLKVKE